MNNLELLQASKLKEILGAQHKIDGESPFFCFSIIEAKRVGKSEKTLNEHIPQVAAEALVTYAFPTFIVIDQLLTWFSAATA